MASAREAAFDREKSDGFIGKEEGEATRLAKFQEMLQAEESYVDIVQLREASRSGIPEKFRGEVWKNLLGIYPSMESKDRIEDTKTQTSVEYDPELAKEITEEATSFLERHPSVKKKTSLGRLVRLVGSVIHSRPKIQYRPGLVHMVGSVVAAVDHWVDTPNVFLRIYDLKTTYMGSHSIGEELAQLLALVRRFLPSLRRVLINEDLSPNRWALPWIQNLLSDSLPLSCTLRLWDAYLSESDGWKLHKFVCLAILATLEEEMQEMDREELHCFLRHLPALDVELLILRAKNMQEGEAANATSMLDRKAISNPSLL